jgi:Zn-dependent protease/CBS domain-containing protein
MADASTGARRAATQGTSGHRRKASQPAGFIGAIPLGRIFGIPIAADWSVLIIFGLVAAQLGMVALPMWHPEWDAGTTWGVALGAAFLFFVSILLHELSHSVVAKARGMEVRGITLFIFGGVSQMEGEAPSPGAEFWVAIVGPLMSLVLGFAGLFGASALGADRLAGANEENLPELLATLSPGATLLLWLGFMNLILAVFNMVPGFPLDGGRVLRSILWAITGSLEKATRWASRAGQVVAFLLIAWGVMVLLQGHLVGGLWRILIGWFLNNAAKASYQQMRVQQVLSDVVVSQVMRDDVRTVGPGATVGELVRDHMMRTDQRSFPVMEGERLVGLVSLTDVRKLPQEEWEQTQVGRIMTAASELITVSPDAPADEALRLLGTHDVDQLPVMRGRELTGLLRRQDLLRWLSFQTELSGGKGHGA